MALKKLKYIAGRYLLERRDSRKGETNLAKIKKRITGLSAWEQRAETIRKGILAGARLDPLPEKTPLNTVIHGKKVYGDYSIENVYFESIPGFFVTGNLYRPAFPAKPTKLPAILLPHGHRPKGRLDESYRYWAGTLARMGAVILTYDMVGFNDSTQVRHKSPHALTFQLWDSIRALDFLVGLEYTDNERIGVTGSSGGATQGILLAAIDPRVEATVPVIMVSSSFFGGCVCESGLPIHRGKNYATNNAEIAALAAPRPQLLVSVGKDWTRLTPTREYPFIKRIYALYDAEDKVKNIHLAGEGHDYGPSKRMAVYGFFARNFGLEIDRVRGEDGRVDESGTLLGEPEEMRAFNDTFKRPGGALKSDEQILAALEGLR